MIWWNRKLRVLGAGFVVGLYFILGTPADAGPVTTTVQGTVVIAEGSNPFGLSVGDSVTATARYEDSLIPAAGSFNLAFDSNPAFSLIITLGGFTFVATDDDDFGSGLPRFTFSNGAVSGIEFERDGFSFGGFADLTLGAFSNETQWFLDDNLGPVGVLLEGTWDFANAVTLPDSVAVAVSEPATLLLFMAGLACFFSSCRTRVGHQARRPRD